MDSFGHGCLICRRDLFRTAAKSVLFAATAQTAKPGDPPLLLAEIGKAISEPNSHGDTWNGTWADDDQIYTSSCDTLGFNDAARSNLAVHRITGTPPNVTGVTVNPMKAFGGWAEVNESDGATWKTGGLASIDGALYLAVSRHGSPFSARYNIQQSWDSTIIKSTDHGKTWSEAPALNHAMFPGRIFANPYFVQYGKDGRGTKDGADRYAYAISNDGCWNNGNFMVMGRVPRERLPRLDANDWEFIHGFDKESKPIWRPRHDNSWYVFRNPGRTSQAGVHYIEPLDLYILPQWYYTETAQPPVPGLSIKWARRWKATCFELYQAPAPWGPWTLFHSQHFEPEGYYNPSIPAKYISADGRKFWLFASGWPFGAPSGGKSELYRLQLLPVTLRLPGDK